MACESIVFGILWWILGLWIGCQIPSAVTIISISAMRSV